MLRGPGRDGSESRLPPGDPDPPRWGRRGLSESVEQTDALRFLLFPLALVSFLLCSCGAPGDGEEEAIAGGRPLPVADSILIGEENDVYIGDPFSVVLSEGESGALDEIWISDLYSNVIRHFDGGGEFVKRVGSPGPGPAELRAASLAFLASEDQIGVHDMRSREVKWFHRETGELERLSSYETGRPGWTPPFPLDDDSSVLVVPLNDPAAGTSLARLDLETGEWRREGALSERHAGAADRGASWFPAYFAYLAAAPAGEGRVLLAFGGDDTLLLHDLEARRSEPLGRVPRLLRRGVDHRCVELADAELAEAECGPPFDLFSAMRGLWRLPDGRFLLVHLDQRSSGQQPNVVLTGDIFVTILDPERDRACVDLPVPGGRDARPVFAVEGGDFYVLDRRIEGPETRSWLLRFELPTPAECPQSHRVEGWIEPIE